MIMHTGVTGRTEYCLGPLPQIPLGEGRVFQVGDRHVAVFRARSGGVYAAQALCPHRGGPLADGLLGGTTVVGPLHAWKFDLMTGAPVVGTCGVATYTIRLTATEEIMLTVNASQAFEGEAPGKAISDEDIH
jgi:nitrite reductase (NADH) small subunit